VAARAEGRLVSAADLARVVAAAAPARGADAGRIHPATRTFQALRIAVNNELEGLDDFVELAVDLLAPDGRFVGISFHSLEDRILKQELRRLSGHCQCPPRLPVCSCGARKVVEVLTRRPVAPSAREIEENPRARSAKLRAARKLVSQ
jgi:16S rRNA (cytosine1402-N4)-methyltransferase